MVRKPIVSVAAFMSLLFAVSLAAFQAYAPVVTMTVTLPDGQTKELTAAESGLATITLKDGTEYGFRPTLQDDRPWTRTVITIFKLGSTTEQVGEVEVKTGAAAVQAKTIPVFKVAIPKVEPPKPATPTT